MLPGINQNSNYCRENFPYVHCVQATRRTIVVELYDLIKIYDHSKALFIGRVPASIFSLILSIKVLHGNNGYVL